MQAIEIEGLDFGFGSNDLFRKFAFRTSYPITILEGASGCGKTTFLRLIAGQLPFDKATKWNVPSDMRLILQDDGLFPWLTGEGNLLLVQDWVGFDRLNPNVEQLGKVVEQYSSQISGTLSFGQRRLLEVFRVLAFPARLVLLDEPLNFLDSSRRNLVIETIAALADNGTKFLISSHYETDYKSLECETLQFDGDMPYKELSVKHHNEK